MRLGPLFPQSSWWLALGLAVLGCRAQGNPALKRGLELVPCHLDLGVLTQNATARADVQLHNPGASAVRLASGASTTRCRWKVLPDAIAARTTIPLAVACQSDLLGRIEEELTILDATRADVVAALRVVGSVEPIIGFDTSFVDLRPEFGQTTSADVHLVGKRALEAAPTVITTGGDVVRVARLAPAAGRIGGFRLSCRGDRVGMHAGSMVVDTGIADKPQLTLSWGCRVPATLAIEPSNPYFNLRVSGDRPTTIVVRSSQSGFRVGSARIIEGPFRATLGRPGPDGSTPVTVRVNNDEIPDEARAVTGRLLIESSDEREPRKEVPLFGFGKVNKADRPASN
ncbi:MAG: hypothetical protein JW940_20655 [Polyangiaceae bacterium]|nr:hypothetical protein [Polyangiaceae bacterium]